MCLMTRSFRKMWHVKGGLQYQNNEKSVQLGVTQTVSVKNKGILSRKIWDLALSEKVVDSDQSLRDNLKGQMQGQLITSHNYFHGCSIFWKTLFSLLSLLECLIFVLILSTGDCNVDISEQLFYRVKDLVLCCISTSYILFEAFLSFGIKHALWDTTISGVYHSFQANSSNKFRKLRKAGKRFVLVQSFIKSPIYSGLKTTQNCFFTTHLFFRQSWTKFLRHFCISGAFSNTGPSPHLALQTMLNACIQKFFRISSLYSMGGGRTARKFQKGCAVLWGNREMTEKYEYCSTVPRTFVHHCRCA